jgi:hypothetical protein
MTRHGWQGFVGQSQIIFDGRQDLQHALQLHRPVPRGSDNMPSRAGLPTPTS